MKKFLAAIISLIFPFLSAAGADASKVKIGQTINIRALDTSELAGFESDRIWVNQLLEKSDSNLKLTCTKTDLPTLQTLLDNGPYSTNASAELVTFGTVFGDVLAHEIGLHWVVLTDEFGTDFALQFKDDSIFVFPRDMIVKRVERGENVKEIDLGFVLNEIHKTVLDQKRKISVSEKKLQ